MPENKFRIGIGYDIHRFTEGRSLIIGGVKLPYEKGLLGHSDADVLTHAIIDALLGAAALPDIGTLFPDNDPKYSGANSLTLLKQVVNLVEKEGFEIGNIDTNIIAQKPKMMPHIPIIKETLSKALGINIENLSVKAKTKEGLDSVGEMLAIESQAVVMIYKKE